MRFRSCKNLSTDQKRSKLQVSCSCPWVFDTANVNLDGFVLHTHYAKDVACGHGCGKPIIATSFQSIFGWEARHSGQHNTSAQGSYCWPNALIKIAWPLTALVCWDQSGQFFSPRNGFWLKQLCQFTFQSDSQCPLTKQAVVDKIMEQNKLPCVAELLQSVILFLRIN